MAADRQLPTSVSAPPVSGPSYLDAVQEEITKLYDISTIKLTGVSGTDTISGTPAPALTGALVNGMRFELVPANTTTSTSVTLNVGTGAFPVLDKLGAALTVGALEAGGHYLVTWDSSLNSFCLLTEGTQTGADTISEVGIRNLAFGNGGFEIWQRGAGDSASIAVAASTTAYTADRWYLTTGANQASTVAAVTALSNRSYRAARVQRNNGQTGVATMTFGYPLSLKECVRARATNLWLIAFLNPGANWSPATGSIAANVYFGTGTEGKRGGGFTGETNPISTIVDLTTFSVVAEFADSSALGSNLTQGEIQFTWTPVGTAGAADYFDIDDVWLLPSTDPVAPVFEYLPFEIMLQNCQRHFAKTFPYNTAPAQNAGASGCLAGVGTPAWANWRFPVQMRTSPTITTYNPSAAASSWRDFTGAANSTETVNPNSVASQDSMFVRSGAVAAGNSLGIHATADAGL